MGAGGEMEEGEGKKGSVDVNMEEGRRRGLKMRKQRKGGIIRRRRGERIRMRRKNTKEN